MTYLLRSDDTNCDPLLLWLFPDAHPRAHNTLGSPLHLVLKAMDHLPRNFENVLTNLSTCLVLPLSSMVTNPHPHPPYCASWRDLKVHHLYKIDQDIDTLVPIDPSRPLHRSITVNRIL
ncbi:hypothetical protein CLU79DRAFT_746722 [Phycomyces nitens]|nr:hypothetical protein CLU79DRAFT_746722 [Phycomyces nitens]